MVLAACLCKWVQAVKVVGQVSILKLSWSVEHSRALRSVYVATQPALSYVCRQANFQCSAVQYSTSTCMTCLRHYAPVDACPQMFV